MNPKTIYAILTTECTYSCQWCYCASYKSNGFVEMSNETIEKLFEIAISLKCSEIVLLGGEPTLYTNIVATIKRAATLNLTIIIVTNGSNITYDFLDTIQDCKENIVFNFSIEGASANIHDSVTNKKGSFVKLLESCKRTGEKGFRANAIFTLCENNKCDLIALSELLPLYSINSLMINYALYPMNSEFNPDDFLTVDEFCRTISNSARSISNNFNLSIGASIPECKLSKEINGMITEGRIRHSSNCHLISGAGLVVDPEGYVLPCTHMPELKLTQINNNKITDILELLEQKFRSKLRFYPKKECSSCIENDKCFGGCPILWVK